MVLKEPVLFALIEIIFFVLRGIPLRGAGGGVGKDHTEIHKGGQSSSSGQPLKGCLQSSFSPDAEYLAEVVEESAELLPCLYKDRKDACEEGYALPFFFFLHISVFTHISTHWLFVCTGCLSHSLHFPSSCPSTLPQSYQVL